MGVFAVLLACLAAVTLGEARTLTGPCALPLRRARPASLVNRMLDLRGGALVADLQPDVDVCAGVVVL